MYEKMRKKQYTKSYLKKKEKRREKPNNYPKTRLILIRDFIKSNDLYKAIGFFLASQVALIIIASGQKTPSYAGAMNLLGILIGIATIIFAIREINKRQAIDDTRRQFRWKTVWKTFFIMLLSILAVSVLSQLLGVTVYKQPNQVSLDDLKEQFPVAMLFLMIIVSPIVEEIVFRELLPYATGPSYLSFAISSFIFVALHSPSGFLGWTTYTILAAGFTYARLKDNNVYNGIALHIIWNTFSILL